MPEAVLKNICPGCSKFENCQFEDADVGECSDFKVKDCRGQTDGNK
jgi:hypothetical protein